MSTFNGIPYNYPITEIPDSGICYGCVRIRLLRNTSYYHLIIAIHLLLCRGKIAVLIPSTFHLNKA